MKELQVVTVMSLGFGLVGIDRFLISTLYPVIARDLHLSYGDIGIITGALAIAWGFAALVMGNLSDRLGHRTILILALIVFSLMIGASGLATGLGVLILVRIAMGFADGAFAPVSIASTLAASAPHRSGRNMGIQQMMMPLFGLGLSPLFVAFALKYIQWRWVFLMFVLPGLLLTLAVWRIMPASARTSSQRASILAAWRTVIHYRNVRVASVLMLCWLTCLIRPGHCDRRILRRRTGARRRRPGGATVRHRACPVVAGGRGGPGFLAVFHDPPEGRCTDRRIRGSLFVSKVIISCAITGAMHTPAMSDALPITPEQIAAESIAAAQAGAAIIHLHARKPQDGEPTGNPDIFAQFLPRIHAETDAVINLTTGGSPAMSVADRLAGARRFKPEMCSLNMGSMNFAIFPAAKRIKSWKYGWEEDYVRNSDDFIFRNTFRDIQYILEIMGAAGTKFEHECYDVGHLYNLAHFLDSGMVKPPLFVQLIFGILGGIGADLDNLLFMKRTADRLFGAQNFQWSVLAAGRHQMPFLTQAALLGGNVRVGLEDSLFIERGKMAASNAEQVHKIRRILLEMGHEPATPTEARAMLALKGKSNVTIPPPGGQFKTPHQWPGQIAPFDSGRTG